jgi:hypothetical protein
VTMGLVPYGLVTYLHAPFNYLIFFRIFFASLIYRGNEKFIFRFILYICAYLLVTYWLVTYLHVPYNYLIYFRNFFASLIYRSTENSFSDLSPDIGSAPVALALVPYQGIWLIHRHWSHTKAFGSILETD